MSAESIYILVVVVAVSLALGLDYTDTRGQVAPAWILEKNKEVNMRTLFFLPFLFVGLMLLLMRTINGRPYFEELIMSALLSLIFAAALLSMGRGLGAYLHKHLLQDAARRPSS
jgi:hypothetical protein